MDQQQLTEEMAKVNATLHSTEMKFSTLKIEYEDVELTLQKLKVKMLELQQQELQLLIAAQKVSDEACFKTTVEEPLEQEEEDSSGGEEEYPEESVQDESNVTTVQSHKRQQKRQCRNLAIELSQWQQGHYCRYRQRFRKNFHLKPIAEHQEEEVSGEEESCTLCVPHEAPNTESHSSSGSVQVQEPTIEQTSSSSELWQTVRALARRAVQATKNAVVGFARSLYRDAVNRRNLTFVAVSLLSYVVQSAFVYVNCHYQDVPVWISESSDIPEWDPESVPTLQHAFTLWSLHHG